MSERSYGKSEDILMEQGNKYMEQYKMRLELKEQETLVQCPFKP